MDIPSQIKVLLRTKGLTQKEFADKIGKSKQTVLNYFNGRTKIDIETLEKISIELDIPIESFFIDNFESKKEYDEKISQLKDEKLSLSRALVSNEVAFRQQIDIIKALLILVEGIFEERLTAKNINMGGIDYIYDFYIKNYEDFFLSTLRKDKNSKIGVEHLIKQFIQDYEFSSSPSSWPNKTNFFQ